VSDVGLLPGQGHHQLHRPRRVLPVGLSDLQHWDPHLRQEQRQPIHHGGAAQDSGDATVDVDPRASRFNIFILGVLVVCSI
jgi:hypothetical protein